MESVDLYEKVSETIKDHNIGDIISALSFALADSVAYATNYEYDQDNVDSAVATIRSMYRFLCETSQTSSTVN